MSENVSQMDSEMSRRRSFLNCPHVDEWSARELARYGWHYDKQLKKVRCHVCRREVAIPCRDEASIRDVHVHRCHIARNIALHNNQESLMSRRICREFDRLGILPVELAIEVHILRGIYPSDLSGERFVRRGNIPAQRNVSSLEVLTDDSTHVQRGGFPIQVQSDEGPSARLVNGRIYNRHEFYDQRRIEPPLESAIEENVRRGNIPDQRNVSSLEVLTDDSTHDPRGGFPVQVQDNEGPSSRLVNGRIYNRHEFYDQRRIEDR